MQFVDTSFLIGLFLPEDAHHNKAENIFQKNQEELLVLFEVLTETLTLFNRIKGIELTNQIYSQLQENQRFTFKQPAASQTHEEAFSFFLSQKTGKNLSYVDALEVIISKQSGIGIITFDEKISEALKVK